MRLSTKNEPQGSFSYKTLQEPFLTKRCEHLSVPVRGNKSILIQMTQHKTLLMQWSDQFMYRKEQESVPHWSEELQKNSRVIACPKTLEQETKQRPSLSLYKLRIAKRAK